MLQIYSQILNQQVSKFKFTNVLTSINLTLETIIKDRTQRLSFDIFLF